MSSATRVRLCVMMFLEFFIWGGWFVTMGSYLASNLASTGAQTALAYSTQSWGAIIAPFIVGLVADRFFRAERLLGVIHLTGAALLYVLSQAQRFGDFYPYLLLYMVLYMPTLALVNAVAFRQMDEPARHFGKIRVWGTIGWIVAGLMISYVFSWDAPEALRAGALRHTFRLCAAASVLLGAFSFTLPATPPTASSGNRLNVGEILGVGALSLLRDRNFLAFFAASILICIPLAFYYQNANQFLTELHLANATGKQTIGQVSEILFMLLLPLFLKRFGMKATLAIGMLCWALRYVLFAFGDARGLSLMLLVGIALHGACYDFFFVSGQIYTDSKADPRHRSAAQGLITLATYGVGMMVGFWAAGLISDQYAAHGTHDWRAIWLYPAAFALLVLALFLPTFRNERFTAPPTARRAANFPPPSQ
jgi:nucleoside transporter